MTKLPASTSNAPPQDQDEVVAEECREEPEKSCKLAQAGSRLEGRPRFRSEPVVVGADEQASLYRAAEEMAAAWNELCLLCAERPELVSGFLGLSEVQQALWWSSAPHWHGIARADVFLTGDIALRRAIQRLYGFDHVPTENELSDLSDRWRPYRSLAVSYLFASEYG